MSSSPALKGKPRSRSMEPPPPAMASPAPEQQVGVAHGLPQPGEPGDTPSTARVTGCRKLALASPESAETCRRGGHNAMRKEKVRPRDSWGAEDVMAMGPAAAHQDVYLRAHRLTSGSSRLFERLANGGKTAREGRWQGWCPHPSASLSAAKTHLSLGASQTNCFLSLTPFHCSATPLCPLPWRKLSGGTITGAQRGSLASIGKGGVGGLGTTKHDQMLFRQGWRHPGPTL